MLHFFLERRCGVDLETSRTCTGNIDIFIATVCSLLRWCNINECNVNKCNMNERALLLFGS